MYIGSTGNFKSIVKGTTKMTKNNNSFDKILVFEIQLNSVDNLTFFYKRNILMNNQQFYLLKDMLLCSFVYRKHARRIFMCKIIMS